MSYDKFHPTKECQYCKRVFSIQNLARHEEKCSSNPEVIRIKKETICKCEYCEKDYSLVDGVSKRFCSVGCRQAFSTKDVDKNQTKLVNCIGCGKEYEVNFRAAPARCKCVDCKGAKPSRVAKPKRIAKPSRVAIPKKPNKGSNAPCFFCGRQLKTLAAKVSHEKSCKLKQQGKRLVRGDHRKDIRTGYIYMVTNKVNGKFYIGKKKGKPEESKTYLGSGLHLKNALNKYGKENFEKRILEYIENGDLNERERFWISKYKAFTSSKGYNLSEGGDGGPLFKGRKHTKETKERIRKIRITARGEGQAT